MFKNRKEFEEALVKSVLEKSLKDMEGHIDSAMGAHAKTTHVEHGYHKADGGTSMIEYDRGTPSEKHVKEHVIPYLKSKGHEVEHQPKYDNQSGRVFVNQKKMTKADMGRGGRPKDVGMFNSEHMNHVVKLKDHGEAKKYAHGIVDASAARPENKDKARKMINSSKHPVHLGSGMANFALAAEGLGVGKADVAPPPPPPPSGGLDFSPASEPISITGVNAISKAEDIHPRHLGSVDNNGGKVHVFASSASHHRHLPGLHHEVSGASTMGSDSSKWHPSVHEAIGRAKTGGFPRVVLHEPGKKQVYNQSNMSKEDSSLTSQSANIPQAGRITKTELLKVYLEGLKDKLIKAQGHLGEYWKQPLNLPKSNIPVAEKIIYNKNRKPYKAPITAREEIEQNKVKQEPIDKAERKIIRPKGEEKPTYKHGIQPSKITMHTAKIGYSPMGTSDRPRDHATYSEHVILHDNKPIGLATVHHSHPSDHGKTTNKLGGTHEHSVEVHAPSIHEDAHSMLRAKVKEHVNSKDFKRIVDKHNEDKHDYKKPKFWLDDKKKKKE